MGRKGMEEKEKEWKKINVKYIINVRTEVR